MQLLEKNINLLEFELFQSCSSEINKKLEEIAFKKDLMQKMILDLILNLKSENLFLNFDVELEVFCQNILNEHDLNKDLNLKTKFEYFNDFGYNFIFLF